MISIATGPLYTFASLFSRRIATVGHMPQFLNSPYYSWSVDTKLLSKTLYYFERPMLAVGFKQMKIPRSPSMTRTWRINDLMTSITQNILPLDIDFMNGHVMFYFDGIYSIIIPRLDLSLLRINCSFVNSVVIPMRTVLLVRNKQDPMSPVIRKQWEIFENK